MDPEETFAAMLEAQSHGMTDAAKEHAHDLQQWLEKRRLRALVLDRCWRSVGRDDHWNAGDGLLPSGLPFHSFRRQGRAHAPSRLAAIVMASSKSADIDERFSHVKTPLAPAPRQLFWHVQS